MRPLLVGFTGLSGSGKTTLTRAVLADFKEKGFQCSLFDAADNPELVRLKKERRFSTLKNISYFAFLCRQYTRIALRVLYYAFRAAPLRPGANIRSVFVLLIRLRVVKNHIGDAYDIIILDETFIHNIWSIAIMRGFPERQGLTQLIKSLSADLSQAIVFVDVDVDLAVDRINQRLHGHSPFDRMRPHEVQQILDERSTLIHEITSDVIQLTRVPFLKINGREPVKQNAERVSRFIARTWAAHLGQDGPPISTKPSVMFIIWHDL